MGQTYRAISFNRQKVIYDMVLWGGILLYIATFLGAGAVWYPNAAPETLLIRALATCAFLLLHVVLSIGPLTRLDKRFLPLLYNRRHLGVSIFLLALAHAGISIFQFHGFGVLNPFVSVLISDGSFGEPGLVPFQPLGFLALILLALLAVTSHDFWLAQLTAPTWKKLHMLIYVAYGLLVAHVAFGALQDTVSPIPFLLTVMGAVWIVTIHLVAAGREVDTDRGLSSMNEDGYVDVCTASDIENGRAIGATISGERVAVFRNGDRFSAVSAVCQHQNGPLDEGRIVDGLITCPWHGYQYCPLTGESPEPFSEVIPTFPIRIVDGNIQVAHWPNPKGTSSEPAIWKEAHGS